MTLFTNATLLTDELVRWLSSMPPASVDVTLYGASPETYHRLCGVSEGFQQAINGIELLLKYGINTRIKTTVVKSNIHDYYKIKERAESYHVEFFSSHLIHGHRSNGMDPCINERLTPDEMQQFDIENMDQYDCAMQDYNLDVLKKQYRDLPAMSCMAAKCSYSINWKGFMTPCTLFDNPCTEPLKEGFEAAWQRLGGLSDEIPSCEQCRSCERRAFCPVCPPRLYLETGSFDKASDYLCEIARKKEAFVHQIYGSRVP